MLKHYSWYTFFATPIFFKTLFFNKYNLYGYVPNRYCFIPHSWQHHDIFVRLQSIPIYLRARIQFFYAFQPILKCCLYILFVAYIPKHITVYPSLYDILQTDPTQSNGRVIFKGDFGQLVDKPTRRHTDSQTKCRTRRQKISQLVDTRKSSRRHPKSQLVDKIMLQPWPNC